MLIASLVLYSFVGSRTGIICTLIFLFLFLFDNRKLASYLKLLTPLFTILLIALSIFVGFKYGQTENNVNDLLTTRPYQWHLRLDNGALTNLFNNSDTYVKDVVDQSVSFPLDNQYIYLLARAGWLPLIAVMILYFIGNRRNKSPIIIYMIFTSIVLCFVESLMFTAIVNVGLIFILSNLLLVDYKGGET